MKEQYILTEEPFARKLITPHDFVIKELHISPDLLEFVFEDDITYHDGIKEMFPGKRSLILRFRLCDDTVLAYRETRKRFPWQRHGYVDFDVQKLPGLCEKRLEYIEHHFSWQSVIIELSALSGEILLDARADSVEYEWLE